MARLDPGGVAAVASGAGFTGEALRVAVAVSFAENGGHDTAALGDTTITNATWGPSVGLWQIRSLKAQTGKGTERDQNALTDPAFNARAAYKISNGGRNWSAWSTYNDGKWRGQLGAADSAIKAYQDGRAAGTIRDALGAPVGAVAGAVGGGLDIGGRITAGVNSLMGNVFKVGINAGALMLALVLLVLGIVLLMQKQIRKGAGAVAAVAGSAVGGAPRVAKVTAAAAPGSRVATGAAKAASVAKAVGK